MVFLELLVLLLNSAGVDTVTLGTDGFGAMLLRYGQKVNIYDATLATQRTLAVQPEITFFDLANKQIKLTPATTGLLQLTLSLLFQVLQALILLVCMVFLTIITVLLLELGLGLIVHHS
jgi:hypothetical protein